MGGGGDDTLTGGAGDDVLNGGAGGDRFIYTSASDGDDRIVGFDASAGDVIEFKQVLVGFTLSDLSDYLRTVQDGNDTIIEVDVAGDGGGVFTADFSIRLVDVSSVDLNALIDSGAVSINATAPVAIDSAAKLPAGPGGSGILTATDAEGGPLSFALESVASHGAVVVQSDGTYTYTPSVGFTGLDSFGFRVTDSNGLSSVATVSVTVTDLVSLSATGESLVNTTTTDEQRNPEVTALSDGGYVVVWESNGQDGSGLGLYAQRYDDSGSPIGGEFQINTETANGQQLPEVTGLSGGGFVVTWTSFQEGAPASSNGIYGQRFDAAGNAVGVEFHINTETFHEQVHPTITGLSNGGFVAAWTSFLQDGNEAGIYVQRFDASGVAVGSEFRANTSTSSSSPRQNPSIADLSDGGFVVMWESFGQDAHAAGDFGIYGQRYDASGMRSAASSM